MNLQDLKAAYLSRHRASLDDNATHHVGGFVLFLEATLAALEPAEPLVLPEGETLEQMVANATAAAVQTARTAWEVELNSHVEGAVEAARLAWDEEAAAKAAGTSAMPAVAAALADGQAAPEAAPAAAPAADAPAVDATPPADPPAA